MSDDLQQLAELDRLRKDIDKAEYDVLRAQQRLEAVRRARLEYITRNRKSD